MIRVIRSFLLASLLAGLASAQTTVPSGQTMKGTLLPKLGTLHHPVSTTNAEAQKFFDQGLTLMYAFNHDESIRSFMRAAELDPNLAMAHWGIAQALGPNYNVDVDLPREKAAYDEIQKAIQLSSGASQAEKDYINALAVRYSNAASPDLKKLAADYKNAMEQLSRKYPDDLDVATLYAESMMLLRPWQLWDRVGRPAQDTLLLVATLESVLKRNPDHIGANHLYIHAIEASPYPQRGLEAAARLPGLAPGAGHLVHMPAHIYSRVGDHEAAAGSNDSAVAADQAYIKDRNDMGIYPMMYYSHNLHFLSYAESMQGNYANSIKAANQLADNVRPHLVHMPMLEGFVVTPTIVMSRFGKWDDILKIPEPPQNQQVSRLMRSFARSLAYASTGKPDQAEVERKAMNDLAKSMPADAMWGLLNTAAAVMAVSDAYLGAEIALAKNDLRSAIAQLTDAVNKEDALAYDEPPPWWFSVREDLAIALLRDKRASEAESVLRKELDYSARNGRALAILVEALKAQGKPYEAGLIDQQFKAAWKNADTAAPMTTR